MHAYICKYLKKVKIKAKENIFFFKEKDDLKEIFLNLPSIKVINE